MGNLNCSMNSYSYPLGFWDGLFVGAWHAVLSTVKWLATLSCMACRAERFNNNLLPCEEDAKFSWERRVVFIRAAPELLKADYTETRKRQACSSHPMGYMALQTQGNGPMSLLPPVLCQNCVRQPPSTCVYSMEQRHSTHPQ